MASVRGRTRRASSSGIRSCINYTAELRWSLDHHFGWSLYRKLELLALHHPCVVHVEEVAVENRLDQTGGNGDPVRLVRGLGEVAVDPVGDVQRPVAAQREQVVRRDGLGLSGALQHEELRQDGHRLQPDGEGPHDLGDGVLVGEEDGEDGGAAQEVLDAEGVDVGVVRGLVGVAHEVEDVPLRAHEHDLEDEVVDALRLEDVCRVVRSEFRDTVEHRFRRVRSVPRYLVT